jgi:hypothetical protein
MEEMAAAAGWPAARRGRSRPRHRRLRGREARGPARRVAQAAPTAQPPRTNGRSAREALPIAPFVVAAGVAALVGQDGNEGVGLALALVALAVSLGAARSGRIIAGVGAALALFAAGYALADLLDGDAVSNVGSLGAYFLASLTVGVTSGPFGLELAHGALVVAFIQLLTTLAAAGAAVVFVATSRTGDQTQQQAPPRLGHEEPPPPPEPDHRCPLCGR